MLNSNEKTRNIVLFIGATLLIITEMVTLKTSANMASNGFSWESHRGLIVFWSIALLLALTVSPLGRRFFRVTDDELTIYHRSKALSIAFSSMLISTVVFYFLSGFWGLFQENFSKIEVAQFIFVVGLSSISYSFAALESGAESAEAK